MKVLKIAGWTILSVVVLLLVTVLALPLWISPASKLATKICVPKFLGVEGFLSALHLNPYSGKLEVEQLRLGNPVEKGFSQNDSFSVSNVAVDVEVSSLTKDTIVVRNVGIQEPNVRVETLDSLMNFVAMTASDESKPKKEETPKEEKQDDGKSKNIQLDRFLLGNAKVSIVSNNVRQTELAVGAVTAKLDAKEGAVGIENVRLANPDGFTANNAFSLGKLAVSVDPSFITDTNAEMTVKNVEVQSAHARIETKDGQLNFLAMIPPTGETKSDKPEAKVEEKNDDAPVKLPVLEKVNIADTQLVIASKDKTQTAVTIGNVAAKLNAAQGEVQIDEIKVANPEGYTKNDAFSLGNLSVEINPAFISDANAPIHVKNVAVKSPHVRMETLDGKINFLAMAPEIASAPAAEPKQEKAEEPKQTEPVKLPQLDKLSVEDIQFVMASKDKTQVAARIATVAAKLDAKEGAVSVEGIAVSNPDGFSKNEAFSLKKFAASVDPSFISDSTKPIAVKSVEIVEPAIRMEADGKTLNFLAMTPEISSGNEAPVEKKADEPAKSSEPVKLPTLEKFSLVKTSFTIASNDADRVVATVDDVSAALTENSGNLSIAGVRVTNPKGLGFTDNDAFSLAGVKVEIDPAFIADDKAHIHVRNVDIDSPYVRMETLGKQINFAAMAPAIETAPASDEVAAKKEEPAEKQSQPKEILLDRFSLRNTQFAVLSNTVERLGLSIAEVSATMDTATGRIEVANFRLGNPSNVGYTTNDAVSVSNVLVVVDAKSLTATNNVLIINEIAIDHPVIRLEGQFGNPFGNLLAIKDCFPAGDEDAAPASTNETVKAEEKTDDAGKKVIIDHFIIRDGEVMFAPIAGQAVPIPLPTIELNDIGKDKGGASFIETVTGIGEAIVKSIYSVVLGVGNLAGNLVGGTFNLGTNLLGSVGSSITGASTNLLGETAGGVVNAGVDAIGAVGGGAIKAGGETVNAVGNVIGKGVSGLGGVLGLGGKSEEKKDEPDEKKDENPVGGAVKTLKKLF